MTLAGALPPCDLRYAQPGPFAVTGVVEGSVDDGRGRAGDLRSSRALKG